MSARLVAIGACAIAALAAPAAAAPAPPPPAGRLVVALNMPSEGFQVGAAQGTRVTVARGLEIELARALAAQLGLKASFYQEASFGRLLAAGPKPWQIALAEITITPARARRVGFSAPYLSADQGVLLAKGVATPRSVAALRPLRLCALASSTGASLVATRIRPQSAPIVEGSATALTQDLQTGRCQAAVEDAPILATLKARVPLRYGPFAGVIRTGEQYGIALPKGSALRPAVNQALATLVADGTLARLQRRWLTTNLGALPVLS